MQELVVENKALQTQLARDRVTHTSLSAALANAQRTATVARSALQSIRNDNRSLEAERSLLKARMANTEDTEADERYHDRLVGLQDELKKSEDYSDELLKKNKELNVKIINNEYAIIELGKQAEAKDKQLEELSVIVDKLNQHVANEKSSMASTEAALARANADLRSHTDAYKSAQKAAEEHEVRAFKTQLEFDDLKQQWQETQHEKEELEQRMAIIDELEHQVMALQNDVDNHHEQSADYERTLMVKDERISHLEAQVQKLAYQNMAATDAAHAAAATSPIDEPPHPFQTLGDSLEDELNAAADDGESFYEHLGHSDILEIIDIEPIEPTPAPTSTTIVREAGSIAPIDATRAELSTYIEQVTSVSPRAMTHPNLSLHVNEAGNVAPVDSSKPELTVHTKEAGSVSPVDAAHPDLSIHITKTGTVTPMDVSKPELTVHTNEAGNVAPFELSRAKLTIHANGVVDLPPVDAVRSPLTIDVNESGSLTPIDISKPELTMHVSGASSVTPVDVMRPDLTYHIHEAGSVTPVGQVRPDLTMHVSEAGQVSAMNMKRPDLSIRPDEAGRVAPVEIELPRLTVHVNEVADIAPIEVETTPAVPPLATTLVQTSVLDYSSVSPPRVDAATQSTQTVAPELSMHVVGHAIVGVAPVDIPEIDIVSTTTASIQTLISNPTIKVTPVTVTYEEWPLEEIVPKNPTANVLTQTTPLVDVSELPEVTEQGTYTLPLHAPTSPTSIPELISWLLFTVDRMFWAIIAIVLQIFPRLKQQIPLKISPWLLRLFALVVTVLCYKFWVQLQAWETANGVGGCYGLSNMADYSGAYGNGRYLFGTIPLAMTEGSNGLSQWMSRTLSVAIMQYETWAGISYVPLY